jgi:hypothetical protein
MRLQQRHMAIAAMMSILATSSGCKQYKAEVVLNEDGSGRRTLELVSANISEGDLEIGLDEFRRLFALEKKRGWTMRQEIQQTNEGEEPGTYVFTLDRKAEDVASWRAMSGDISVSATPEKGPYENIALRNEIEVTVTDDNVYTYRETLSWNRLKENIVAFQSNFFRESIAATYPFLSKGELDALQSFFAGVLVVAWYAEEVADNKMNDEMYTSAVSDYAEWTIRSGHPGEDLGGIREVIERTIDERGEKMLDAYIIEKLPGVYLAGHTSMAFRITMPGEITETNAHRVEGQTAIWEYDLMVAPFNRPVKLFVQSERAQ